MSYEAYIVYTFQLSLHHANFGQFKAKQVLSVTIFLSIDVFPEFSLYTSLINGKEL